MLLADRHTEATTTGRPAGARPSGWGRSVALSAVPMGLLLLVTFAVATANGVDFNRLAGDANSVSGLPFYTGVVSSLGIALWTAAGTAALLAVWVARTAEPALRRLLAVLGGLSLWLGVDDLLMVHEGRLRELVGVHERPVFLAYGLLVAGLLLAQRRVVLTRTAWPVLGVALALLAASVVYDSLFEGQLLTLPVSRSTAVFIEESAKQLGIAVWLAYVLGLSRQVLRATAADPEAGGPTGA